MQAQVQTKIGKAHVIVTAAFSLHSNAIEKCPHQFDTVLVDDASMISESDVISSLRKEAKRLVLYFNSEMKTNMFLIN